MLGIAHSLPRVPIVDAMGQVSRLSESNALPSSETLWELTGAPKRAACGDVSQGGDLSARSVWLTTRIISIWTAECG